MAYEDLYNFYGYPLTVRSNTLRSLDHIRFLYQRFLVRRELVGDPPASLEGRDAEKRLEIRDHLEDFGGITASYGQCTNRLSASEDGSYVCSSSWDQHHKIINYPSLFSFYQGMMISAIGNLIQKSHVFIHAGAVSWKGKGIIFPSRPNSGKSTLSVYLSRLGFRFLSDEIACYNLVRGVLEAHPRSVRLRESSHDLLDLRLKGADIVQDRATGKCIVDIEDIVDADGVLGEPCPLHFIFFLKGFSEKPRLRPLEKFMGLRQLLGFCFNPKDDGAVSFAWIAPMVHEARCYELTLGPLDETASVLMDTCDREYSDAT